MTVWETVRRFAFKSGSVVHSSAWKLQLLCLPNLKYCIFVLAIFKRFKIYRFICPRKDSLLLIQCSGQVFLDINCCLLKRKFYTSTVINYNKLF